MAPHTSKALLYQQIAAMRGDYGITLRDYPIDTLALAATHAKVVVHPFDAPGLYGMARAGTRQDSIALSSYRTAPERRFDCGHEMVHLYKHRHLQSGAFTCYIGMHPVQDPILEWEANAGSAEFIVPYRLFLREVAANIEDCQTEQAYRKFRVHLSRLFKTTLPIISLRFEDLKYELEQYLHGTPLNEVEIVSHHGQQLRDISVASFNSIHRVNPTGTTGLLPPNKL